VDASLIVADANKQRSIPGSQWNKVLDAQVASRATKEYLATLDDAAFGAASEVRRSLCHHPIRPPNGPARCAAPRSLLMPTII
jgi:hypothetical protein